MDATRTGWLDDGLTEAAGGDWESLAEPSSYTGMTSLGLPNQPSMKRGRGTGPVRHKSKTKGKSQGSGLPAARRELDPRNGTWLDVDLRLLGAKGAALLSAVISSLDGDAKQQARRRDHSANHERRVECVVANALRTHFYRESARVSYNTSNQAYPGERWRSAASLKATIALMASAGLIDRQGGARAYNKDDRYAATFWMAEPLKAIVASCQVDALTVGKPPTPVSTLIQMRDGKDESGKKPLGKFDQTEDSDRWATDLDRYNRFADSHRIDLSMGACRGHAAVVAAFNWKLAESDSRQPGITQPEFFDRHLRRIFNDGTFEHGGRLYGAWYQRIPAWLRAKILIEGDHTVELDYSGMSMRMIYHRQGMPYLDDPYSIPELEAKAIRQGHKKDHYRDLVKTLVQALLNGEDDEKRPEMVKLGHKLPHGFTRARMKDLIVAKHDPIREAFGAGLGKKLQRLDSDIALDVILSLMEKDILCLPVHDSFIVMEHCRQVLHEQMVVSYQQQLGHEPIIK